MVNTTEFYEVLSVGQNASDAELKTAYRKIARENHPDTHPGDTKAEAKFKEASEAYSVLSDLEKRTAYDRYGRPGIRFGKAVHPSEDTIDDPEKILFMDNLNFFTNGGMCHSYTHKRIRLAPDLQASLEKHPDWHTPDVCRKILRQIIKEGRPELEHLTQFLTADNPRIEKILFSERVVFFANDPVCQDTIKKRVELVPHLQSALKKHPEWNMPDVQKSLSKFLNSWGRFAPALEQLRDSLSPAIIPFHVRPATQLEMR